MARVIKLFGILLAVVLGKCFVLLILNKSSKIKLKINLKKRKDEKTWN